MLRLALTSIALVLLLTARIDADPRWWQHDRPLTSDADQKYYIDVAVAQEDSPTGPIGAIVISYLAVDSVSHEPHIWILVSPDFGCTWCDPKLWVLNSDIGFGAVNVEVAVIGSQYLSIQVLYLDSAGIRADALIAYDASLDLTETPDVVCANLASIIPSEKYLSVEQGGGDSWYTHVSINKAEGSSGLTHFHGSWYHCGASCPDIIEYSNDLVGDGSWTAPGRVLFRGDGGPSFITADTVADGPGESAVSLFHCRRWPSASILMARSNRSGSTGSWTPAPLITVSDTNAEGASVFSVDSSTSGTGDTGVWNGAAWVDPAQKKIFFDAAFWDDPSDLNPTIGFETPGDLLVSDLTSFFGFSLYEEPVLSIGSQGSHDPTGFLVYWLKKDSPRELDIRGGILDPSGTPPRDLSIFPFSPARTVPPDPAVSVAGPLTHCSWDEATGECTSIWQPSDTHEGLGHFKAADGRGFDLPSVFVVAFTYFLGSWDDENQISIKMTDGHVEVPVLLDVTASCRSAGEGQIDISFELLPECPAATFPPEFIERYLVYYGTSGPSGPFPERIEVPNAGLADPHSVTIGGLTSGQTYTFALIAEDEARNINPQDFDQNSGSNTLAVQQYRTVTVPDCNPDLALVSCDFVDAYCAGSSDGIPHKGDMVELTVTLQNAGNWPAANISGTIVATGARIVSPPQGDLGFLDLSIGVGASVDIPVTILLDTDCPIPPDPTLSLTSLASDGGAVSYPDLSCPAPVIIVDCSQTCDTGCITADLLPVSYLRGEKAGESGILFTWDILADGASVYHLNAVDIKTDLTPPGPHRQPVAGSVGQAVCDASSMNVICTDHDAFAISPELIFYRVAGACGPTGDDEGPI
ncbi:hypothetical protein ACFLU6_05795 [Acidobacteriota bacterium]